MRREFKIGERVCLKGHPKMPYIVLSPKDRDTGCVLLEYTNHLGGSIAFLMRPNKLRRLTKKVEKLKTVDFEKAGYTITRTTYNGQAVTVIQDKCKNIRYVETLGKAGGPDWYNTSSALESILGTWLEMYSDGVPLRIDAF